MNILGVASAFSVLVPVVAGIIRYQRLDKALKVFAWFIFLSLLFDAAFVYTANRGINNLVLSSLFRIIQYAAFSMLFYYSFRSRIIRKGIMAILICFLFFSVVNLLFLQGASQFNTWTQGISCILLILFVLLFFFELFKAGKVKRLERYPLFWVASAALLYFAGSMFLFIFSNLVLAVSNEALDGLYSIHSVINMVANIIYAIGLWLSPRK